MIAALWSPPRLGAFVRRGTLAGALLPGLLLVNLLCLCAHGAAASADPVGPRGHCETHADGGATDTQTPAPHEQGGGACPHCGDGSALFASPRAASALSLPLLDAILVQRAVLAVPLPVERPLRVAHGDHSPPPLFARNGVLQL